ncbi:haloacid dehalogenase type II [Paracoccus nototheniae]|jgi:2-haloalkanoic acid dehalogenase, type II|uniref:(S)-2-haloacid dehalogenase n=2 Tax=Paracoccaceae TaxID=31989 RepID=A0A2T6ABH2_9RHOB|nr:MULTISPECIES: haloacid dehalogenase type II [Paracoccaceae]PTX41159.1 2-haloacid dehalogenase [Gemmobacter caeni]TWI93894.1 2-haloacid dehalogenase [Gemmobacter caeni]
MPLKAIAFDAYGTLFDVYSVSSMAEELFPGKGAQLAALWRDKQIEYTRLRTLCHQYADFWQVTGDALDYSFTALGLDLAPSSRNRLMGQYAELSAFSENAGQLKRLKDAGIALSILSNGTPWMLDQALKASGLDEYFEHVLSVDAVKRFKTAPEAYQMGPDTFGCDATDILFVSSNCWDICGATWFGYRTIWLNRYGLPLERLGVKPHQIGASLKDVADYAMELNN